MRQEHAFVRSPYEHHLDLVTSDRSGEVFVGLDSEQAREVLFLVNPGGGEVVLEQPQRRKVP